MQVASTKMDTATTMTKIVTVLLTLVPVNNIVSWQRYMRLRAAAEGMAENATVFDTGQQFTIAPRTNDQIEADVGLAMTQAELKKMSLDL